MATASPDGWTEEKCLLLIQEYRSRPILWDPKDPFFFKKNLKPIAWQEIAESVEISADQCKHKMTILMSSFRREKAKIIHSIKKLPGESSIDTTNRYTSTWFAFKEMAFLLDKESERKRQLNDSDDMDEEESPASNMKSTILKHHIDSIPTPKRIKTTNSAKKELGKTKQTEQTKTPQRQEPDVSPQPSPTPTCDQQIPGPSQTVAERDEEIQSFTSFIGNKMKKYTDTTKNAVQQAICEIIFKADQKFYENCFETFTIIDDGIDPLHKRLFDGELHTVAKLQHYSESD